MAHKIYSMQPMGARGRARGPTAPFSEDLAPVVGNFGFFWTNFGKMMEANCIFYPFQPLVGRL